MRYIPLAAILLAVCASISARGESAPRACLVLPCEVVEWHDGDTGTVRVTVDIRVRLLDCWAPEVKGRSLTDAEKHLSPTEKQIILDKIAAEKRRGQDSLRSVSQIAPVGSRGQLEIPFANVERSDDLFTMGRVLGRVWIDGKDVSALQVDSGHAKAAK
jgi:endonuclease YncB( thermonuclease family)